MQSVDDDGLGPQLHERLCAELDGIQPPFSPPRYLTAKARTVMWRVTPAVVAAGAVVILALTAYAGSPNPVVWTQQVVTGVHSAASPTPTHTHTPTPTSTPAHRAPIPTPSQPPEQHETPEPSPPSDQHESPEPASSGAQEGSSAGSGD
jgi:hypothetical protein